MKDHIEFKSYEVLKNNGCINQWVRYFYECELYKKMLPSHRIDPKTDRYVLDTLHDKELFEQKRKILYAKFIANLSPNYSTRKVMVMKKKVIKLNMKMLRAMYLLTENKKIYRYSQRFANGSGFEKEVFDVDTQD